jgi:hypothetical protein
MFSVLEADEPAGFRPPMHIHRESTTPSRSPTSSSGARADPPESKEDPRERAPELVYAHRPAAAERAAPVLVGWGWEAATGDGEAPVDEGQPHEDEELVVGPVPT